MPHIDPLIALAGLGVGFVVGLTGMGGGALMTPILIILFRVQPLAAIGSDLVASLVMKPVGSAVHWRRHTIEFGVVKWLVLSSVPAAFLGVSATRLLGSGPELQGRLSIALGIALLLSAIGVGAKSLLDAHRTRRTGIETISDAPVVTRTLPTVLVGAIGGFIVGVTSVGSGSLIMVMLMLVYPRLSSRRLVGTDILQAVPLVGAAALGHVYYGDFSLVITLSILVGSIPGVFLGAQFSSLAPDLVVRPLLIFALIASALRLIGISTLGTAEDLIALAFSLPALWGLVDALRWQNHHWEKAGHSRRRWLWLQGLGVLAVGPGVVAPLVYFTRARPKLAAAAIQPVEESVA